MSSSMPDSRRVSLAPVNTPAPSGISSRSRDRAAAVPSRISTVKPCSLSAAAVCCRRSSVTASANDVVGPDVVMKAPVLVVGSCHTVRQASRAQCEVGPSPDNSVGCRVVPVTGPRGREDAMGTPAEPGDGPDLDVVMSERRQLINVAYRLLGSLAEAEDVVQETYARYYAMSAAQRAGIESPGAWLTTVASRTCLNLLGSARARRERYVGDWIPEPLPDRTEWPNEAGAAIDPADRVTLDESVSMAFLVVLDSMTPAERVAFVLHDVFRYPFAEVAEIVGRTPAACRQLASSARRRIGAEVPAPPTAQRAEIVRNFKRAWEAK